jgi:phosphatidate cytidylyltransferase
LRELLTRSVTGIIYALLLVGSVILHPIAFLIVYLAITILSLKEFFKLAQKEGTKPQQIAGLITAAVIFLITFLVHFSGISAKWYLIVPFLLLIILISEIFRKKNNPYLNLSMLVLGLVYVALPITSANMVLFNSYTPGYSFELLIFFYMILWVYDTGAYLVGSLIGRHKLSKRLSPKKSWEGLAGGVVLALAINAIFGGLFNSIPAPDRWVIAVVIIIAGTFGDLFESLWKRSLGIKDSGKVLPGHGGWLDRLDSILFALPSVYLTVEIMKAL